MAESEEELKGLLMKVKEESEKDDLKLNIRKTKIMASGPITSWQIDGETVERVKDFILGGAPKSLQMVNAAMKFKRCLLLGRKFTTNLDRILKSRDSTLSIKVHLVKAMVFPVVMYGCGSWTIKQAESESEVAHSCTTLWDPMDCSLPGSSVHGIFQARILEWVAISFSRGSSNLGIEPRSPAL